MAVPGSWPRSCRHGVGAPVSSLSARTERISVMSSSGSSSSSSSSSSPRSSSSGTLQTYRLLLYHRAVHPELFRIRGRRTYGTGDFEFETWLAAGAHMLRFETGGRCAVEVVTAEPAGLPRSGLETAFPCAGEREHDTIIGERLGYITSTQTEMLSEHLFRSTLDEMQHHVVEQPEGSVQSHRWRAEGARSDSLSVLAVQTYRREIHTQAWHLDARNGLVLRTQAIFETLPGATPRRR